MKLYSCMREYLRTGTSEDMKEQIRTFFKDKIDHNLKEIEEN
jgi:hypothetical protein